MSAHPETRVESPTRAHCLTSRTAGVSACCGSAQNDPNDVRQKQSKTPSPSQSVGAVFFVCSVEEDLLSEPGLVLGQPQGLTSRCEAPAMHMPLSSQVRVPGKGDYKASEKLPKILLRTVPRC